MFEECSFGTTTVLTPPLGTEPRWDVHSAVHGWRITTRWLPGRRHNPPDSPAPAMLSCPLGRPWAQALRCVVGRAEDRLSAVPAPRGEKALPQAAWLGPRAA